MYRIKLVIADDHPIFLTGLKQVLNSKNNFDIIGAGETGAEALELIKKLNPDVAILDLDMPHMNGFEVAKALLSIHNKTKLIFLTMHDEKDLLNEALELGVMGYVLKENALTDIIAAVEHVNSGEHFISPLLTEKLLNGTGIGNLLGEKKLLIEKLTGMEKKILTLIAHQKTTKEIGEELFISPRTVEKHRSNICSKLNITGNNALLKFALDHKNYF